MTIVFFIWVIFFFVIGTGLPGDIPWYILIPIGLGINYIMKRNEW
jgi:hypothetical protein